MSDGTQEVLQSPWTSSLPLSDLTLMGDWDSVASMVESLRYHLFVHGTIPTWNFTFCGGRPELSVPFSWAWTPTSAFAYLLPANAAIVAVWISMSLIGFVSLYALLKRWTATRVGAAIGACIYTFSGVLILRFMVGHVSFAFHHLIPVLLLLFDSAFSRALEGRRVVGVTLGSTLVAFALFSAGLPHTLYYFYPALMLLVAIRFGVATRTLGWRPSLAAAWPPLAGQALGLWLAAYKLWPAIRWQVEFPRRGVLMEAVSPATVLGNVFSFWPEVWTTGLLMRPPHMASAYLGPFAALLGLVGIWAWIRHRGAISDARADPTGVLVPIFAVSLVTAGFLLALGNANPLSPASLFRHIPLLRAVRMFTGYQILIVLGVAVLAAHGVGALSRQLRPGPLQRGVLTGLLLLGAGLPLVQATSMISRIGAVSNASQFDAYHALPFPKPAEMMQVARFRPFSPTPRGAFGNQTLMLQRGYWIANCYSNLALPAPHPRAPVARTLPLSSPPPIRIDRLRSDRLTLAYGRSRAQNIRLNLRALESFRFDAPVASRDGARVTFSRNQLSDDKLTIIARYPGLAEGALASVAGLSASAGFFVWLMRRKGGSRPT